MDRYFEELNRLFLASFPVSDENLLKSNNGFSLLPAREVLIKVIAGNGSTKELGILLHMASGDPSLEHRLYASEILAINYSHYDALWDLVVENASSSKPQDRVFAARLIRERFVSSEAGAVLEKLLHDKCPEVLVAALHGIAFQKDMSGLSRVEALKNHSNSEVSEAAGRALALVSPQLLLTNLRKNDLHDVWFSFRRLVELKIPIPPKDLLETIHFLGENGFGFEGDREEYIARATRQSGLFSDLSISELKTKALHFDIRSVAAIAELVSRPKSDEKQVAALELLNAFSDRYDEIDLWWDHIGMLRASLFSDTSQIRYHQLYHEITTDLFFSPTESINGYQQTKTGSDSYLLGGPLAGKVILRSVPIPSLRQWQHALYAESYWKGLGFDEPPIEEILSFSDVVKEFNLSMEDELSLQSFLSDVMRKKRMSHTAFVFARVIPGLTVAATEKYVRMESFPDDHEVKQTIRRIRAGLIGLGVRHGHLHENNFVLVPNGSSYHLHAIDFDEAR